MSLSCRTMVAAIGLVLTVASVSSCQETTDTDIGARETTDTDALDDSNVQIKSDTSVPADIQVEPDESHSSFRMMVSTLAFPVADENGSVPGFDLDDSLGTEVEACGQEDFTDALGNGGIDNQVSILTPLFDLVGVGQIHQYLQESIDSSGFFLLFDLGGVESLESDSAVNLSFEVGGGTGVKGRDGALVPNQTMCVQNDSPGTEATGASIDKGVLHAQFDELTILVSRFERVYPLTLRGARLRADLTQWSKGTITGVVGGGVSLNELMSLVVKMAQNQSNLVETVEPLLSGMGDLPSDGDNCGAMSIGLVFDAVPVFFFPDEVECDPCGNGVCDSFESCETCLADCCPGCGNQMCDQYPVSDYDVMISASGFEGDVTNRLVGDALVFRNMSDEVLNLRCEDMFTAVQMQPGSDYRHTLQGSGEYKCSTYELIGQSVVVSVVDNHSEDCQSCPQDCGDCE